MTQNKVVSKFKKKIFIFDIDNTLCKTTKNFYEKAIPKKKMITLVNKLYKNGHIIKLFTSRYMGRSNQNVKVVKSRYKKKTENQLKSWGLNYNKLIMGKPSYDFFVDDKSINPKTVNIYKILKKFI